MIVVALLIAFELIIGPKLVLAISPPSQISPANNTTVSSSKLTWETPSFSLYSNNPYRIQIDDNPDFSSVYRDYNTKNTYYTPVLNDGLWYWRIKVKDSTATWSDWSSVWSFKLTSETTTSTPAPISASSPTPAPSSSPATTSTPSSFTISDVPPQINSDQNFTVSVSLNSSSNPDTIFYLKGAFKKNGSTNYFGFTKIADNWIKNGSSFTDQYKITADSSGNWNGSLEVKPDEEDTGFSGSGDYIFKVGKYNSADANPSVSWSNESSVKITDTQSSYAESTTPPSYNPSPTSKIADTKIKSSSPKSSYNDTLTYHSASVAAATTSSALLENPKDKSININKKSLNTISIIGFGMIVAGASILGYILFKQKLLINLWKRS